MIKIPAHDINLHFSALFINSGYTMDIVCDVVLALPLVTEFGLSQAVPCGQRNEKRVWVLVPSE